MLFIAFAEGLGQPYPLQCHAAQPRSTNLRFSSTSQTSNEKRFFFSQCPCLLSGHKPFACRIQPYRNAPSAPEPTPLLSPFPRAPGLFFLPARDKVHPARHFIAVPAQKSPQVSHSRVAPGLEEPSFASQPVPIPAVGRQMTHPFSGGCSATRGEMLSSLVATRTVQLL